MTEKLESNEQVLLMYLAGELPDDDRADVERMLATDPSLQRDLQQMQSLQSTVEHGLARLDEISPLPVSSNFAARQVSRAIRQQLARPKVAPVRATSDGPSRSWWWLYPTVAAASVAMIAMVWLNRQASTPVKLHGPAPLVTPEPDSVADSQANQGEADDALLLESLSPPVGSDRQEAHPSDEDARQQVASGDGMPQDEISQYLLNATAAGQ